MSGWAIPPSCDPARTEITTVTIRGGRATVLTREFNAQLSPVAPTDGRYTLELEDGEWLLSSRWIRESHFGDWSRGELE